MEGARALLRRRGGLLAIVASGPQRMLAHWGPSILEG